MGCCLRRLPRVEAGGNSVMVADMPVRIPFRATYPAGHEWHGIIIERGRECGCGRWFPQHVVSKAWLSALTKSQREAFIESCEVVRKADDLARYIAWHPQRCHRCSRRML